MGALVENSAFVGKLKQIRGFVGEIQAKRSSVGEIETKHLFVGVFVFYSPIYEIKPYIKDRTRIKQPKLNLVTVDRN